MTTATKAAGSAATSRSAPTTSTPSCWDHITALLADPALIRAEISKRLDAARTADPATRQRKQLELALAKAATAITAMIEAYSEQLITIDELRARMPHLRARETSLRGQIDALDAQPPTGTPTSSSPTTWKASSPSCAATPPPPPSKTASASCGCSSRTSSSAPRKSPSGTASPPAPGGSGARQRDPGPDTEGDHRPGYLLRWGREDAALGGPGQCLFPVSEVGEDPGFQERLHQRAARAYP